MISFFILAGIPALYWGWLFYIGNRFKRTNNKLMVYLFIGGVICAGFALTLNHIIEKYTLFWSGSYELGTIFGLFEPFPVYRLGFWFMVGFNEEFAKLSALLLIAFHRKNFQESYDGILFVSMVALGFATIENAIYVDRYGLSILVVRTLITLPIHVFISAPMGYFVAQARILLNSEPKDASVLKAIGLILKGWLIAAILHAGYDSFLSIDQQKFAYTQFLIMGIMTFWLSWYSLKQSKLAPPQANKQS